jgi:hypothetical protein
VYRGEEIPELRGAYLFGDTCQGEVYALTQRDGRLVEERTLVEAPQVVSFGADAGVTYVLSLAGTVYRLDAA